MRDGTTTLAPIEWSSGPKYSATATFEVASYQDPDGPGGAPYVQWVAGNSFEEVDDGIDCTPIEENVGAPGDCQLAAPGVPGSPCPVSQVCVDSDGDGVWHCSTILPAHPACAGTGDVCANLDGDGDAHCVLPDRSADPGPDCTPPEGAAGEACTPNPLGAVPLTSPDPPLCDHEAVCVDSDGDGTPHCTALVQTCQPGLVCVNTNNDEVAHCRPAPALVNITDEPELAQIPELAGQEVPEAGGFRLRGRIVRPAAAGQFPLVVLAHGKHEPRRVRDPVCEGPWPDSWCRWSSRDDAELSYATFLKEDPEKLAAGGHKRTPDESYRGYDYLQRHLASQGYVVASVDLEECDGSQSLGYPGVAGDGIRLRGWLISQHLLWLEQAVGGGIEWLGVHLVGHSRGGEGVVAAQSLLEGPLAHWDTLPVLSATAVAPSSFREPTLAPTGQPFLLLWGTADGDVDGFTPISRPFELLDRAPGPRAGVVAHGLNHNHFNRSWSNDDARPWIPDLSQDVPGVVTGYALAPEGVVPVAEQVSRAEQERFLEAYLLAWLRHADGEAGYPSLFEESAVRLNPLGAPATQLWKQHRSLRGDPTVIDDFETGSGSEVASSGVSVANDLASTLEVQLRDPADEPATSSLSANLSGFVQDTMGWVVKWSVFGTGIVFEMPSGLTDLRPHRRLRVRLAQQPRDETLGEGQGARQIQLTLTDADGTVALGAAFLPAMAAVTARKLYPHIDADGTPLSHDVPVAIFETFQFPIDRATVDGATFDPGNVTHASVRFQSPNGYAGIDDVEVTP